MGSDHRRIGTFDSLQWVRHERALSADVLELWLLGIAFRSFEQGRTHSD